MARTRSSRALRSLIASWADTGKPVADELKGPHSVDGVGRFGRKERRQFRLATAVANTVKGKSTDQADADEILPEYDFSRASRNKHASKYPAGSAVVVLEPDVAAAFPSSGEANEALRALAGIIQKHRSRRPASRRNL